MSREDLDDAGGMIDACVHRMACDEARVEAQDGRIENRIAAHDELVVRIAYSGVDRLIGVRTHGCDLTLESRLEQVAPILDHLLKGQHIRAASILDPPGGQLRAIGKPTPPAEETVEYVQVDEAHVLVCPGGPRVG
jgi:hypothetical protein